MRFRLPDGWPGLVGIVVLMAGLAAVLGRPGVTPLPVAGSDVGGYLPDFTFAAPAGPTVPLAIDSAPDAYSDADAWASDLGESGYAERHQTLIGLFDSTDAWQEAFSQVNLPDGTTMLSMDRLRLVSGITTGDAAPADLAEPFLHASQGLIEGDRGGEGSVVMDLRCSAPSDEAAARIATAIGDYGAAPYYTYLRPPWLGPPLTADEELARATYRRWSQAFAGIVESDPFLADWARRMAEADTTDERVALQEELNRHILQQVPTLEGDVHPGVMALLSTRPDTAEGDDYLEWGLELAQFMGMVPVATAGEEPSWYEQRHGGSIGSVRSSGSTVEIGWASFNTFSLGGFGLLAYLHEQGCAEVHVALSDFDDVRGD